MRFTPERGGKDMEAFEIVQASRDKSRPTAVKYIEKMIDGFIGLSGDRAFGDDPAVVAGIGRLNGRPVTVIGIEKGVGIEDKVAHNFGCALPEGYRKALRLMREAEKFHRPVLCLVDTSGAFCGIGAEERGQAEAIASCIRSGMELKTPVLSIIIGEGGSGGALALASADEVWMTETATYSVISPEGCASILWKDSGKVAEAAEKLKLTAADLSSLKAVERVVEENGFGDGFFSKLKTDISEFFADKCAKPTDELLDARYARFRAFK